MSDTAEGLSQLATRAEQAGVEEQRELINEAALELCPVWKMPDLLLFERRIAAQAFTDAAMMLKPEEYRLQLSEWDDLRLRERGPWQAILVPNGARCNLGFAGLRCDHATTPALAILAAICKAKGGEYV